MKKIIKPKSEEESVYYTDFLGKPCNPYPSVELTLEFNYGSDFDSTTIKLDLSDEEVYPILEIIKKNLSENTKKHLECSLKNSNILEHLISHE